MQLCVIACDQMNLLMMNNDIILLNFNIFVEVDFILC